jgi:hypothetical protein
MDCRQSVVLGLILFLLLAGTVLGRPIDTREYGLLERGMTQAEVIRRVGEPDRITELGDRKTVYRSRGDLIVESEKREAWDYDGSFSYPPRRLIFSNGVLVKKIRKR